MNRNSVIVAVLVLIGSSTVTHSAFAGGFWRFYISVDGKPAFTGGIGVFGEYSPLDHLESSVAGVVQLGTDSYLDENTKGDVTLTGDVVFRDQHHPPLHMKQIRLVYRPDESFRASGGTVAGGFYDWRLHPDDAAFIVRHYRGSVEPADASPLPKTSAESSVESASKSASKSAIVEAATGVEPADTSRTAKILAVIVAASVVGACMVVWRRSRLRRQRSPNSLVSVP